MPKEQLYKNAHTKHSLQSQSPDVIWRDKNIDDEVERFRVNYERWCINHPDKVKHTGGRNNRRMEADDYIKKFLRHIEAIQAEADKLRWPWEWCIDDQSENGKYFCPFWVILGDSRIFSVNGSELSVKPVAQELRKGKNAKKTTQLNDRYRIQNALYKNSSSINVENFVCNYFRRRPNVADGVKLEAGHIYSFDRSKSSIVNNNMINVKWQTVNDNRSIQKLFANGNNREAFRREAERLGIEMGVADNIQAMMDSVNDPRVETGIEFSRDENGLGKITIRTSRQIVPYNK